MTQLDTNEQRAEESVVSVEKSAIKLSSETQLVQIKLRTTAENPVRATLTDPIPDTHAVKLDDGTAYTDGVLTFDQTVQPGEVRRIDYPLVGPTATSLSASTIESVTRVDSESPLSIAWTGNDGSTAMPAVAAENGETASLLAAPETAVNTADAMQGAAIGVILTTDNEDAVVRTVLRARRNGLQVFATTQGVEADAEALDLLETLGTPVLSPPSKWASQLELHRLLSRAARERGLSGIVLQTRDCPRIDYDRTATAFAVSDYEVIAIPELWNQSPENPSVVVGIPAYNAAESIATVVESAFPFAEDVLVVDDGSHDATADCAREAGATVVTHERNRGYGGALKTLFREADDLGAAHLVIIDADGQHDPGDIPALIETQCRDDADIVIGSRYVGERRTKIPVARSLGLAVINNLTNASMGKLRPSGFIRDTQSGYRAYSRAAIRSLATDSSIGNNMGASTDILYHAHRARLSVAEVPTTISYDVENASSQGSLSHGLDLIRNIFWTVEYGRPLLILGLPGAIMTLLGVAISVLLVVQYVETDTLAAIPLATSILFALGGLLVCVTSLMMHVLNGHPTLKGLRDEDNS
ncbi:glycosyltransferase family 2 protein [Haloarcula sp. CBA1130]|uniref:glycosyltransferase family 2 protein n=1 Tax=unclassified Haloarcula TaxID=2624677 RepID=UPI0012471E93|nr:MULTISPECIES: glycosyltransferase family 2 protein [unclassified Haloarcula]KAA9396479.1 glycosyltransferase family 2 protein [Haloarcula sp. CBA1130]KAA9397664.1 glycosyltransferase family 2 protein [Haloarcula sp. CBA1129]